MFFRKKVSCLLFLLVIAFQSAFAQDPHYSQQYATRLLLNPGFAGLQAEANATAAYRNQWPTLAGNFATNTLTADMRFKKSKSGAGLVIQLDEAGNLGFTQFELGGIYSYHTRLTKKLGFSAGLQATYGSRRLDFNRLTFGDQITDDGVQTNASAEKSTFDPVRYFSVGAGGLFYSEQAWLSMAMFHLNQPDLGLYDTSKLPLKTVISGGYKFFANSYTSQNKFYELSFSPVLTYTSQGPFAKIEAGVYTVYTPVSVGILFRTSQFTATSDQSVIFVGGLEVNMFRIGYSYDLGLNGISAASGGAHELSLTVVKEDLTKIFKKRASDKNYLQIACPAF